MNEAFAEQILRTTNPIGRRFRQQVSPREPDPLFQVVGEVRNPKYGDVRETPGPIAYFPEAQELSPDAVLTEVQVLLTAHVPLAQVTAALTMAAREVSPAILVSYRTLEEDIHRSFLRERLMAILSGFFGALAALIAMIGLYGVMSYSVARRRNEIGVRMALGADGRQVVRMIMREAAGMLLIGLVVGSLLALAAGRPASALLFGLRPNDPAILAMAVAALAGVAVLASYLPAARAAEVEPTVALRAE